MNTDTQDQLPTDSSATGIGTGNNEQQNAEVVNTSAVEKSEEPSKEGVDGEATDAPHPHHHTSALNAMHNVHSAVNHVLPHHRGLDL